MLADGGCASAARRCWRWSATRATVAAIPDERAADRLGAARTDRSTRMRAAATAARRGSTTAGPTTCSVRGRVVRGDVEAALARAAVAAAGDVRDGYVEHAYIEPEAGYAVRVERPDRRSVATHADAVHGPRRGGARARHRAGAGPHHAVGLRRRLRRQARPLGPAARSRSPRGSSAARSAGVYTRPESMRGDDQAPSRRGCAASAGADADGRLTGVRFPRRLRHRRLRLVGADGRQPRARPRQRARMPCRAVARARPAAIYTNGPSPARSAASACRRPRSRARR